MGTAQHRWNPKSSNKPNRAQRLAYIGFAILVAFAGFLWWVVSYENLITYVSSISVTEYRKPLRPITPWDSKRMVEAASTFGQRPFEELPGNKVLENSQNVKEHLVRLERSIPTSGFPMVVLLRCHAAARLVESKLECELLINESGAAPYYLSDLCNDLLQLPTSNIIVLADICDITFEPSEGIAINPLSSAISETCQRLSEEVSGSNQSLWILCAAADGQTSLRDRAGTTLFQKACEAAFDSNERILTLDSFYESVFRYCWIGSQKQQAPLLFSTHHAKTPVMLDDPKAQGLRLSIRESRIKSPEPLPDNPTSNPDTEINKQDTSPDKKETDKKKIEADAKQTSLLQMDLSPSPRTHFIRFAPQESPQPNKIETIWELRDSWDEQKKNGDKWIWSGPQYAAFDWRLALTESAKDKTGYSRSILRAWLAREEGMNRTDLLQSPLDSVLNSRTKTYWEAPEELPGSEKDRQLWADLRHRYWTYQRAVSEYIFWRDLILEVPVAPRPTTIYSPTSTSTIWQSFRSDFESYSKYLEQFHKRLPKDDKDGAIRAWQSISQEVPDESSFERLHSNLNDLVNALANDKEWTWCDEHALLVLLESPLLKSKQRHLLAGLKKEVPKSIHDLSDIPFNEIIDQISPRTETPNIALMDRGRFVLDCFHFANNLCSSSPGSSDKPAPLSIVEILKLGAEHPARQASWLSRTALNSSDGSTPPRLRRWHICQLAELDPKTISSLSNDDEGGAGIVVLPIPGDSIDFTTIGNAFIEVKEGQNQSAFQLKAEYVGWDNQSPTHCELSWNSNIENSTSGSLLSLTVNGTPWPKTGMNLPIQNKSIRVEVNLIDKEKLPQDSWIEISSKQPAKQLRIPIYRQFASLDLACFVTKTGTTIPVAGDPPVLFGPVFQETWAPYQFQIVNKLPEARAARVLFYADPKRTLLLAQSNPIQLPPSQIPDMPSTSTAFQLSQAPELEPNLEKVRDKIYVSIEDLEIEAVNGNGETSKTGLAAANKVRQTFKSEIAIQPESPQNALSLTVQSVSNVGQVPTLTMQIKQGDWAPQELNVSVEAIAQEGYGFVNYRETQILKRGDAPKPFRLPALSDESNYLFAVQLPEYPRVKFYELKSDSSIPFSEKPFQSRLTKEAIQIASVVSNLNEIGLESSSLTNRLIDPNGRLRAISFPNFVTTLKKDRVRVNHAAIHVAGELDTPPGNSVRWKLVTKGDGEEGKVLAEGSWRDRSYKPKLQFAVDRLSIRFDVRDLDQEIPLPMLPDNETTQLLLQIEAGVKRAEWLLLFDKSPPLPNGVPKWPPPSRRFTNLEIFADTADLQFFIETRDNEGGSGIERGQFWLSSQRTSNSQDKIIDLDWSSTRTDNGIRISIINTEMMKQLSSGEYWAHLKTYDQAGNEQANHSPIKVIWKSIPRPKD